MHVLFSWDPKMILVIIGAAILIYGICLGSKGKGSNTGSNNHPSSSGGNANSTPYVERKKDPMQHSVSKTDPNYYKWHGKK